MEICKINQRGVVCWYGQSIGVVFPHAFNDGWLFWNREKDKPCVHAYVSRGDAVHALIKEYVNASDPPKGGFFVALA